MKILLSLVFAVFALNSYAQTPPGYPPVNNHGKGVTGIKYQELIGNDPYMGWTELAETRNYNYQGKSIAVEYPRIVKSFPFTYKGEKARGLFAIEYNRFNGKGYLKFQIYLYWPDNSYSYFIAKEYGKQNQVTFYESDELNGRTLDPRKSFDQGGAKVWKFEVENFALLIEDMYDKYLLPLEELTRKALEDAIKK